MRREGVIEGTPVSSRMQHMRFDGESVEEIALVLGGELRLAPFRLPSGAVYQVTVPDGEGRPATMLTLWPAIRRVDAISRAATVVFTDVAAVDLLEGVEVQFRRANRDLLIVARGGKVIVRA
jgi:hypothetical protein